MKGSKLWMLDWIDIPLGADQSVNGVAIPSCAELRLTRSQATETRKFAYVPTTSARISAIGNIKGTKAFLIDDADGKTWIMKGFELGAKPSHTIEQFSVDPAGYFKKLPSGWKFRTKVLDQDLKLVPESGVATIMADEMFKVYDKTGPSYSRYRPKFGIVDKLLDRRSSRRNSRLISPWLVGTDQQRDRNRNVNNAG